MNKLTNAIKHLIIINVILFVVPQLLQLDLTNMLALHFPKNEHFGFWQCMDTKRDKDNLNRIFKKNKKFI